MCSLQFQQPRPRMSRVRDAVAGNVIAHSIVQPLLPPRLCLLVSVCADK